MKIQKSIHTNSIRRLFLMVSAICLLAFTGCSNLDAGAGKGFHTTLIGKTDPRPVPTNQQDLQAFQDLESLRDQVENARATLALAEADAQRGEKLFQTKVISLQELQDWTTKRDQAKASFLKAQHTLEIQGSDNAGVLAGKAALDNAQLNLSYTRVMAEKAAMVTNLDLPPGNYIKVGEPLFTMVTDDSWRAIAYFKETVLHKIRTGQKAKIELVAYPGHVFHGFVQGVGWGITQQDVVLSDSLPTVAPTVNWVRLAQRFPVRVDIIDPDPSFLPLCRVYHYYGSDGWTVSEQS
jgi:multidrug resistance efflux pump